ncbi:MAG: hypothetical protein WKG01_24415 [Kofleriaceae bacterium]
MIEPGIERVLRPTDIGAPSSPSVIATMPASQASRRTTSIEIAVPSAQHPTSDGSGALAGCAEDVSRSSSRRAPRHSAETVTTSSVGERAGRAPRRISCAIATRASARLNRATILRSSVRRLVANAPPDGDERERRALAGSRVAAPGRGLVAICVVIAFAPIQIVNWEPIELRASTSRRHE